MTRVQANDSEAQGPHQGDLFGQPAKTRSAAAIVNRGPAPGVRSSDPIISKLALDKITESGQRLRINNEILRFLRQNPDRAFTYSEIGRSIGHDAVDVMRRLNDLRHDRLVENCGKRACRVNGNLKLVWRAVRL